MTRRPHVVILGGGFAGLDAARGLAHGPVQVTLIDRHNYHLFQPLLYQVATAALSPGDVASPIRWILRRLRNVRVLLASVRDIDTDNKRVQLDVGDVERSIDYDYLIVATGAAHTYFGHQEWASRAPGLKTLDDALEMRRQILLAFEAAERETDQSVQRRLLTFVIIGGGPTGVELAGALAEIARQTLRRDFRTIHPETARVILIEGASQLLGAFPEPLREAAARSLKNLGVEVRVSSMVTSIDEQGVLVGTERISAQTVLWAAGVAASPVGAALRVPLDRVGRVLVEPTLAVPGREGVFVAGDLLALRQDEAWLPGVAQVAKQSGAHAAANILRAVRGEPLLSFRYRDYGSMATIGHGSAVADIGPLEVSGLFAWLIWLLVHIFSLIGFRNRLAVMSEWAWSYVTLQRRVRLITGERLRPSS